MCRGETVSLSLGDIYEPNRQIQAAYWMNSLDGSRVLDEVSFSAGTAEGVTLSPESLGQVDNSFHFAGVGRVKVENAARIQSADDVSFRVNVKADAFGGTLVNLGDGLHLESTVNGELQLTATTDTGNYVVKNTDLTLGAWHKVAVSFSDGQLQLAVDDRVESIAAAGSLIYQPIPLIEESADGAGVSVDYQLVVGEGYSGLLDCLKWYDLSSMPLVKFDNGAEVLDVVIGNDGLVEVSLMSTGNMLTAGSKLSMQNIALVTQEQTQAVTLLSSTTFEVLGGSDTYSRLSCKRASLRSKLF